MSLSISKLFRFLAPVAAVCALVVSMDGTWGTAESVAAPAARSAPTAGSAAPGGATRAPAQASTDRAASSDADSASDEPARERGGSRPRGPATITGKLNLNTATEEQLMQLPTVGPSKAERIVTWRKKNGGFKRVADLRRVKGFGYKTFKRLEPYLDINGETTLAVKR